MSIPQWFIAQPVGSTFFVIVKRAGFPALGVEPRF
jgi:hypothetical protein